MWFSSLPFSQHSQGISPQAALPKTWIITETLQPGIHIAVAVVVVLIGGRHQRARTHSRGHRQGQEQGVGETDMAENAGGAENGADRSAQTGEVTRVLRAVVAASSTAPSRRAASLSWLSVMTLKMRHAGIRFPNSPLLLPAS